MPVSRPTRETWWADPLVLVELFAVANLAFLAVDVAIAHAVNAFEHRAEWIPVAFSLVGTAALLIAMTWGGVRPVRPGSELPGPRAVGQRAARRLEMAVGLGSVAVGVAGLLLHLQSQFFRAATLKSLVYTAPFVAPLAYAGIGLLLLLDRMVAGDTVEWARWVTLLALGGFLGNFILCLCDHAQNGFFQPAEWIGVIAAAVAVGILAAILVIPDNRPLLGLGSAIMLAQAGVGILGAFLHVRADLSQPVGTLGERFLYGAPAFAPLLFADLAVLAVLAFWGLARAALPWPMERDPGGAPPCGE
jgi:hypothetical protein